jgi:transglutaminase-like putative cysteine protease
MRLSVMHRAQYRYSDPVRYTIQTLRLEPRSYQGLTVLNWRVTGDGPGVLPRLVDGLGNIVHCQTVDRPHREVVFTAGGEVETRRADGIALGTIEPLPPLFFLRATPLTTPSDAIAALVRDSGADTRDFEGLHLLMNRIRDRLDHRPAASDGTTTADRALAHGVGVCHDHAHVFCAAARLMGIPARYVSGFLWTGIPGRSCDASHAWAEAFVADRGWVGFDAVHRTCPTENYIRVAVGLDFSAAGPVRALRHGAAEQRLSMEVEIRHLGGDQ